jgi:DNA-directed RNA polymerase sigma subunit (sigma70/sigma32)
MKAFAQNHRDILNNIMDQQDALEQRKEEIDESVKALAEQLEVKPAEVKKIISLIRKERARTGSLDGDQELLDIAKDCA